MYADRLYSMILEQSENLNKLDNIIFVQINLNAVDKLDVKKEKLKYGTDKLVTYGISENLDIKLISKITNKTEKEIIRIKETLE